MDLQAELFQIVDALQQEGIDYALCGGIAVVIHGFPRLTRDIDILVRSEDLDRVREAVGLVGYTPESGMIPFDVGQTRERRIFRVTKAAGRDYLVLDLILVSSALEPVWSSREVHRVGEREITVVSREGLGLMKRAAGRPKDLEDLRQLGIEEEDR